MPTDQERTARALAARLEPALPGCVGVAGGGVHWQVELARGDRAAVIHCFWYDAAAAMMLGMNPANARTREVPPAPAYLGAEYLLTLSERGGRASGGRTRAVEDAAACALAWVRDRAAVGELHPRWEFVDANQRALAVMQSRLVTTAGRCAIECDVFRRELWVYGDGRSCEVEPDGKGRATVHFLLGPAQVAVAEVANPEEAVGLWIDARCSLARLAAAGAVLEPHAEVLEAGAAARWAWLHLTDRLRDPDDVLAWSRGLIARLMQQPAATEFFTFSSLVSLCFSASSHYPWVTDGLPAVWPAPDEKLVVVVREERTVCPVEQAAELVEAALAQAPVRPFFGSATVLALPPANAALARAGARVKAHLVQRMSWLEVTVAAGDREARLGDAAVAFRAAGVACASGRYATLDLAASAARRWVEERAGLEAVAADPQVQDFRPWPADGETE